MATTTVDSAGWLDRLVQDIAHADANSLQSVVGNVPLTRTVFVLWTGARPPPTSGVCDVIFLVIVSRWIAKKWSVCWNQTTLSCELSLVVSRRVILGLSVDIFYSFWSIVFDEVD